MSQISPYKEQLDNMTWSFSRVNAWVTCPYSFKLQYLDRVDKVGSSFAEWGSLCHSLYEDFAKGNLVEFELGEAYDERYPEYMQDDFPPSRGQPLGEKYYDRGKELFDSFEGFPSNWEVLGVEQKIELDIEGYQVVGYIDLLVRDKDDDRLIVIDHKSKSGFKNQNELDHYLKQPYLYAKWVHQQYGEYPKELMFNLFRTGEEVTTRFSEDECEAAMKWFTDTIKKIYEDVDFWDKIELQYEEKGRPLSSYKNNDYFCNYICGCRSSCLRSGLMI